MILPLHNNVLAKFVEEKRMIELADDVKQKLGAFRVLAVGPGRFDIAGNRVPISVEVGDLVKFKDQYAIYMVTDPEDERDYVLIPDEHILCKVISKEVVN